MSGEHNELSEVRGFTALSKEQRSEALREHVYYEIITALGIPKCDTSDESAWEDVHFSRLGHCRVLIDFFSFSRDERKNPVCHQIKTDDVFSEDYGFDNKAFDFPPEDEERLNKDLFHLTYARLRHNPSTKPWPKVYLARVHERCREFVGYLLNKELRDGIVLLERQKWEKLLCVLKSGNTVKISRPGKVWIVEEGLPLEGGLSSFTPVQKITALGDDAQSNTTSQPAIVITSLPKK